jgi:hypothetical protein
MTQRKLEKKLILTAHLKGLSEAKFRGKTRSMAQAEIDEPTYVPGLTPPADEVMQLIDELDDTYTQRNVMRGALKAKTQHIKKLESKISDTIIDQWMPQAQTAIGRDEGKAKRLGFGIKGQDKYNTSDVSVNNSYPIIINLLTSSLRHTLEIVNSHNPKIVLPEDAERIDVYEWFGDDEPPYDLKKLSYLGVAKSGKLVNHFEPDQKDTHVWYVVVYVSKKTGKPCGHKDALKATII